jgi:hypothetical protein
MNNVINRSLLFSVIQLVLYSFKQNRTFFYHLNQVYGLIIFKKARLRNIFLQLILTTFKSASWNQPVLEHGREQIRARTHDPWVERQTPYPLALRSSIQLMFINKTIHAWIRKVVIHISEFVIVPYNIIINVY